MRVLIADPDPDSRDALRRAFAEGGDQVRSIAALAEGARQLAEFHPDAVVAALDFPDGNAVAFLQAAGARDPRRGLYAVIDGLRLEDGVRAMEQGAHDFLWRPVSAGRVALLRQRLASRRQREGLVEETRLRLARTEIAAALPGRSDSWRAVLAAIEQEAAAGEPVLITGEAGTEKESVARAVHSLSPRGAEPFVVSEPGEKPPAPGGTPGEGTLFLPHVERAALSLQRDFHSEIGRPVGRRLLFGSDQDPRDLAGGRLLPELYETLAGHVVHLPPLRERGEDVELLARLFLHDIDGSLTFEAEAMDALTSHDWPGNVAELKGAVRRAAQLAEGPAIGATLMTSVLGRPLAARRSRRRKGPVVRIAVGDSLADVERRLIQRTLTFARGNKKKTAELLKLSLKTIYNKIKEYGLEH